MEKFLRQVLGELVSVLYIGRNFFAKYLAKYCSNFTYDMISDMIMPYSSTIGFQVENLGRRGNPKSQHRLDERACRCATSSTLGSMDVQRFSLRKFKLKPKYVTSHKCNIFVIELKYLTYNLSESLDTQQGDPVFKHYGQQGLVR